ncbi:hypothetical protein TSUD_309290 [Trifolium subterraneum]|uniref:Uncharacterized protein n=1 Tax=Trifolium subterraneum TaxID=3900 RepID=A0A2Z6P4T2_TRISU|nr:hypothetical protein TSUD_309290 [Trifolium subterraneum]
MLKSIFRPSFRKILKSAGEEMAKKMSKDEIMELRKEISEKYKQTIEKLKADWKIIKELRCEALEKQLQSFRETTTLKEASVKKEECMKEAGEDMVKKESKEEIMELPKEMEELKANWKIIEKLRREALVKQHQSFREITTLKEEALNDEKVKEENAAKESAVKKDGKEKANLTNMSAILDNLSRIIMSLDELQAAAVKAQITILKGRTLNVEKLKKEAAKAAAGNEDPKTNMSAICNIASGILSTLDELEALEKGKAREVQIPSVQILIGYVGYGSRQNLKDLKTDNINLENSLKTAEQNLELRDKDLSDNRHLIDTLQQNLKDLKTDNINLENSLKTAEQGLELRDKDLSDNRCFIDTLKENLKKMKNDKVSLENILHKKNTSLKSAEQDSKKLKKDNENLNGSLKSVEQNLEKLKIAYETLEEDYSKLKKTRNIALSDLQVNTWEKELAVGLISKMEAELKSYKEDKETSEEEGDLESRFISNWQAELQSYKEEVEREKNNLRVLGERITRRVETKSKKKI